MPEGTQHWIFLLFALAFLVKAPPFPLHGWVPDTYRSTSIPVLALLSAVLSKVGVYGFLRIVLPVMPDGSQHFQELFIIIAVFSILYGSILAFSQDERAAGGRPTPRSPSWASSCSASSPSTPRAPRAPSSRCSTTGSWWCRCS